MRADRINIDKFSFEYILECKGRKAFNEHGYLIIKGVIKKEREAECLKAARSKDAVHVTVTGADGEEMNVFHGILYESLFRYENGVIILQIHLKTGSYLADIKKHIRSFQKECNDYYSIAKECLMKYDRGNFLIGRIEPAETKEFLMQYQETDWEFLKRVVSISNSVLLPDDETGDVKMYLGIPKFKNIDEIKSDSFCLHRYGHEGRGSKNELGKDGNFWVYEVTEREIYKVGQQIYFNGMKLIIYAMDINFTGSELIHTYYLTAVSAFAVNRTYNPCLSGNSITARVSGVARDKVTIDIDMDENNQADKREFQYATIYSSPDGAGWYCMPEIGDKVRFRFPTEKETDAYVESSVHLQENMDVRKNPEEKSIMNRQKKEILFTPNSLILTNNNGISIELSDEQGIKIMSNKSIMLKASQTIQMNSDSGEIEITAAKSIDMRQGSAQLQIADKIQMAGGKINLN